MQRCLKGDDGAQRRLYNRYVDAVYHTAVRMTGQQALAEDITQETFIRVFQQLATFSGSSSIGAWIKRIAVNATLNHLRQDKRFVPMSEVAEPAQLPSVSEWEKGSQQTLLRIHRAIQSLPEGSRTVLNLHLLEGYQHKEIAEILDITESTSKSQYHRAKKLLQQKLQEFRPTTSGEK